MFCSDATADRRSGHATSCPLTQIRRLMLRLPVELGAELTDARIASLRHDAETRTGDVAARILELSVVEDVEELDADIKGIVLFDEGALQETEVGVVEAGPVDKASVGRAEGSKIGVDRKGGWEEVASRSVRRRATRVRIARIHLYDRPNLIRHVGGRAARKRGVARVLVHLDREAGREAGDPLHLPALCQALRPAAEPAIERNGPNIAADKVVADVSRRQATADCRIGEVD